MSEALTFGELFRQLRIRQRKTLRQFCLENGFDPGNTSKIERGRLEAPQSQEALERYARALGAEPGTEEWQLFFDLAAASAGRIPLDLQSDAEIVSRLPLVFRTLRRQPVDGDQLEELIKVLRKE